MKNYYVVAENVWAFERALKFKFRNLKLGRDYRIRYPGSIPMNFDVYNSSYKGNYEYIGGGGLLHIDHIEKMNLISVEDPKSFDSGYNFLREMLSRGGYKEEEVRAHLKIWEDPESKSAGRRRVNELAKLGS